MEAKSLPRRAGAQLVVEALSYQSHYGAIRRLLLWLAILLYAMTIEIIMEYILQLIGYLSPSVEVAASISSSPMSSSVAAKKSAMSSTDSPFQSINESSKSLLSAN